MKHETIAFQGSEQISDQSKLQAPTNGFLNKLKRNIFKWHRTIGLITIIPVIFWSLSGLMHPFLAHWFKPEIARQFIEIKALDKNQIQLSIQEILKQNNINEFKNFRLVQWNGKTFYQIKKVDDQLQYYNAVDGIELKNADKLYAEFMARYFLDDQKSDIKSITLQTEFNQQYKYINRLLPVWKVNFDRSDNMDVYVETSSDRLGTFNPTSRKVFLWVFDNFHNWSFLDKITSNTLRINIMITLLGIILSSAISGLVIYGLFWKRFKRLNSTNEKKGLRKYHRQIGIATALITLMFAFSGGFHATRKLEPNRLPEMIYDPIIKASDLQTASLSLNLDWDRLFNLSVVKKGKQNFFQAFYIKTEDSPSEIVYINSLDSTIWENGNTEYARYIGNKFLAALNNQKNMASACCEEMGGSRNSNDNDATFLKAELVPKFETREYGFVFKRLPVVRLVYDTPDENVLYVETATSRLAATINSTDRMEGYSFAILHKYLFMDWAGKNIRDITMMLSAFGLLAVSVLGLLVFLKKA